MKKLLQYIGVLAILGSAVGLLSAFQSTARGTIQFKVRQITTSDTASVYANDPAVLRALGITHYRQVCWKREDTAGLEFVYLADEDVSENDQLGWPVVGTEKECQDMDQGIKLYFWHTVGESPKNVKLLFIE